MEEMIGVFLQLCNPVQLIGMGLILYVFYKKLDNKIERKFDECKLDFKEVKQEIKELNTKMHDIDKRLCRIEGSLDSHGHCLFHQQNDRKVG